jgi:hypothetical protein
MTVMDMKNGDNEKIFRAVPSKSILAVLALALTAAEFCMPAQAQQLPANVSIMAEGFVAKNSNSIDKTGVFGFGPNANLSSLPFLLQCSVDSTKGSLSVSPSTGTSAIQGTQGGLGNPMVCGLQIHGRVVTLGAEGPTMSYLQSQVFRSVVVVPGAVTGTGSVQFALAEDNGLDNVGGTASLSAYVPIKGVTSSDYGWWMPLYNTGPDGTGGTGIPNSNISFYFDRWDYGPGGVKQNEIFAFGALTPTVISVSGNLMTLSDKVTAANAGALDFKRAEALDLASLALTLEKARGVGTSEGKEAIQEYQVSNIVDHYLEQISDTLEPGNVELSQEIYNELNGSYALLAALNIAPLGPAVVLDVPSFFYRLKSIMEFKWALDPPDFNFNTVEPPSNLTLPPTGDPIVDQAAADYLKAASLEAAVLHANERWEAAEIVGASGPAAAQLAAFNTYSAQLATAEAALPQDDTKLANHLTPVSASSIPGGVQALVQSINALCGQPLSAALNTELLNLGLSQAQINQEVCAAAQNVTSASINTNFTSLLTTPSP